MRNPTGDRVTGSIPVVPFRTWHSTRTAAFTLNIEQTYGGDLGVHFWVGDGNLDDGDGVLLDQTQIDELITDLLERRALLTTRRPGSERSDR